MLSRLPIILLLLNLFLIKGYAQSIDASGIKVTEDICNKRTGSITGITGPANYNYEWRDTFGNEYTGIEIRNKPWGSYTLTYYDPAAPVVKTYGPVVIKDIQDIIDASNVKLTNAACGESNGSITNLKFYGNNLQIKWGLENAQFPTDFPPTRNLTGLGPGTYTLSVTNEFGCSSSTKFIINEINDIVVNFSGAGITNAACGQSNGSVTNVTATSSYPLAYTWKNAAGVEVANTLELKDQPSGFYSLTVMGGPNGNCSKEYGPALIGSIGGPVIDTSRMVKIADNCQRGSGAIKGINVIGTGNIKYTWYFFPLLGPSQVVGRKPDLERVNAGKYRLMVTDESNCGAVYTDFFTLRANTDLAFDVSKIKVTPNSCEAYASVTGITEQQKEGGLLKYKWMDMETLRIVSREPNLYNFPGGKYKLTVSNLCDTLVAIEFVADLGPKITLITEFRYTLRNSCITQNTGMVSIDAYPKNIQKFRWVNKAGTTLGTSNALNNLGEDDYTLYVTDENGCERFYRTFPVVDVAPVQIADETGQLNQDTCSTRSGSIKNVELINGYPPFNYMWKDAAGKTVSVSADALSLGAGTYTLTVTDQTGCTGPSTTFSLSNIDIPPIAPEINDVQICSSGEAIMRVINPNAKSTYRIYESATSISPIAETKGEFNIKVTKEKSFYVSRVFGDCESPRTQLSVKIGMILTDLTNAFTPNGDGINDFWLIKNIDKYTDALIQVYSRAGQQVYQSRGYAKPFNGTYNGRQLPMGAYYYLITLDNGCKVTGNVSILR